jgi:acid phosphatase (class A)
MRRILTTLVLSGVLAANGLAALAQQKAPEKPAPAGYMGDKGPDSYAILPPAPTAGTFRYGADRSTYLATRKLENTPRWSMAAADAVQTVPALLKDMSCAAGVELTPQSAPKLAKLLETIVPDLRRAVDKPKDLYKRQRPFLIDEGAVCVA